MIVEGTYQFAAPAERVFGILLDPAVIVKVMPGSRDLRHVLDGRYEGVIRVGLGPFGADFALTVQVRDVQAPNHYAMDIDSAGHYGWTRGRAVVDLAPVEEGAATRMAFRADLEVGGTITQLGHNLLDSVSRMMTRHGLEALRHEVERRLRETPPAPPPPSDQGL